MNSDDPTDEGTAIEALKNELRYAKERLKQSDADFDRHLDGVITAARAQPSIQKKIVSITAGIKTLRKEASAKS